MWSNQDTSGYGDQGGGYLSSTQNDAEGGGDRKGQRQRASSIVPCTTAQILSAQEVDDKFMIDNFEINQVTVVGLIRSVKESSTRIEYFVDDMTGPPLDVRQFVAKDVENLPEDRRVPAMRENMYVRVLGHVRSFQGKINVSAFKVLPVTDMNELTTHMLEVIQAHIVLSTGTQGGGQISSQTNFGAANVGDSYQGARPDQGLTPTQAQVHDVIARCMDDQGVSLTEICQSVRGVPQNAIRDAVDFLSSEGHIYSTIDDEHFKSTESM